MSVKVPKSLSMLAGAHFLVDSYSSMLGAFLPFLYDKLDLSLSQAGLLGGILVFSSALMQPVYGLLSDRFQHKVFVALGPGLAGLFISLLGLAPDVATLAVLLFLGGMGIAAFHPQGAAIAASGPEGRAGYQMSFFITGGMIGYALGPIYITSVISLAGLSQSYWAAIPGLLMTGLLLRFGPSPARLPVTTTQSGFGLQLLNNLKPLIILYFLVVIRSAVQIVFVAFLPLYFTQQGFSEIQASRNLTFFLLAGGSAGFLGGILADRLGGRVVIAVSMLGTLPLLGGFLFTDGLLSVGLATAGGAFLLFTTPVNVVMAQRLAPRKASTISALMMGFAWGVGGIFVPIVGAFSDVFGLKVSLFGLVLLTGPGFILALLLPREGAGRRLGQPGLREVAVGKAAGVDIMPGNPEMEG